MSEKIERPVSKGELRVQRNFNPSAKPEVEELKQDYANLIDKLETMNNGQNGREISLAQTQLETSCMYAVKSLFV
jgi:hypothetical protein